MLWATGKADRKAGAQVKATRLIDAQFQYNGWGLNEEQALQWPGDPCPDPDKGLRMAVLLRVCGANFVDFDVVPNAAVDASCEMAKELLIVDRTAAPTGEGIDLTTTGAGVSLKG